MNSLSFIKPYVFSVQNIPKQWRRLQEDRFPSLSPYRRHRCCWNFPPGVNASSQCSIAMELWESEGQVRHRSETLIFSSVAHRLFHFHLQLMQSLWLADLPSPLSYSWIEDFFIFAHSSALTTVCYYCLPPCSVVGCREMALLVSRRWRVASWKASLSLVCCSVTLEVTALFLSRSPRCYSLLPKFSSLPATFPKVHPTCP